MSEATQIPPVVDLDALLQPIPGDNPAGDSLRYSGIYDEIAAARRADDNLNQGEWQTEVKAADHQKVVDVAVNALTTLSKDLQIAAWLSEALIKIHGFAGLRDGLKLMSGLHSQYWDGEDSADDEGTRKGAFPIVEENDQEGRANAVSWLETQGAEAVKDVVITSGAGYSFNDWQDAKRFDFPANIESLDAESQERWNDLKAQAEKENRTTSDKWRSAIAQTKRAFCEQTERTIRECWDAFAELDRVIEEKYDRNQMPGLSSLKKALEDVHAQTKKILEKKRLEEPDPADAETDWSASDSADNSENGGAASGGGGPLNSRPAALKRLEEVAAFFTRTEPHSPVSYLVSRAVKWGNMPLDSWLEDVVKDESVLFQIRQTLGIEGAGASTADSWGESPAEEPSDTSSGSASDEW